MSAALKLRTTVLPGHRIELSAPGLPEGAEVEVTVALPEGGAGGAGADRPSGSVLDFLDSLPPVPRSPDEWAAIDAEFQAERGAWDP